MAEKQTAEAAVEVDGGCAMKIDKRLERER
jgi:hypothetical protein